MVPSCDWASRALIAVLTLAALAEPRALGPARPVQLAKGAADAVIKAIQKDRADTEKWLRSDATSYLATIARRDFGDKKTLTVGRAADNDVRDRRVRYLAPPPARDGRRRPVSCRRRRPAGPLQGQGCVKTKSETVATRPSIRRTFRSTASRCVCRISVSRPSSCSIRRVPASSSTRASGISPSISPIDMSFRSRPTRSLRRS